MPTSSASADLVDVTHRQLAELQRTVATRATQLEQLALDLSRLVGDGGPPAAPSPWSALLDADFRRAWRDEHAGDLRRLIDALGHQANHLGELRRHLLPEVDRAR